jgi:hypothetical protein
MTCYEYMRKKIEKNILAEAGLKMGYLWNNILATSSLHLFLGKSFYASHLLPGGHHILSTPQNLNQPLPKTLKGEKI